MQRIVYYATICIWCNDLYMMQRSVYDAMICIWCNALYMMQRSVYYTTLAIAIHNIYRSDLILYMGNLSISELLRCFLRLTFFGSPIDFLEFYLKFEQRGFRFVSTLLTRHESYRGLVALFVEIFHQQHPTYNGGNIYPLS